LEPDTLLAFDIGTQSSRAALFDFSGNILASSSQTYELENPAPGWAQQDARAWWITTIHNIRAVLERSSISPHRIAAIAACGQMHALIPVDAQGTVLLPAVQLWCDKRSASLIDESSHTPEIAAAHTITGNVPAPS
jgi:xylulokinase